MTSLTVTLPAVPAKAIGGNSRGNSYKRNRTFQKFKADGMVEIRAAMNRTGLWGDVHWQPVALHVTWLYANASHRPDPDNLISRAKAYVDAAIGAGLIANDTPDHITELTLAYERAAKPGIRLTFTLVDEAEKRTA